MIIMGTEVKKNKINFTPSVNIIRDLDLELNYISTPNAKQIFTQLINDYKIGTRSFNIVGAYGTGKSSFLWAFEKNINGKHKYFTELSSLLTTKEFAVLPFVGEYNSIIEIFAKAVGINGKSNLTTENVIGQTDKYYKSLSKTGKGLIILIDEFGKFLEYASKNNPDNELYFIQRLAEYVNDSSKNIFFITTLHQDFNGYSRNLTKSQQNEWDKVKGRLKEITFNEPVEQLLYLASERLNELKIGQKDKNFSPLFKCIEKAKAFPLKDFFTEVFAEKIAPFDILSSAVLTLCLQKYGQNERSLFSFIESNDQLGIKEFSQRKNPYYNLSCVYDYLIHNYYSFLTTRYNPHHSQWAAIRSAIERAEGLINENIEDALKIIKTIGLLNIFASASIKLNADFLADYGKYSLGISDAAKIVKTLENLKIIRFVKHSDKYILFEGIDFDIELAIDEAGNIVEKVTNVVHHLNSYFEFQYISAKAAYYEYGTPRFFAYHLSENPEKLHPEGEVDGFVNLIFSDTITQKEIKGVSKDCKEAVLYGWYRNTNDIRNLLFEVEKIKKVRETHINDKVAVKELDNILQHQIRLLNHYVLGNLFSDTSSVIWFFDGEIVKLSNSKIFNRFLSEICRQIYTRVPVYRNEMVNKTKLSGAIASAKRNFLIALTEKSNEKDLGFDDKRFPPEKTIYLSLLRETGMHIEKKHGFTLDKPTNQNSNFLQLWETCNDFLLSTKNGKRNLSELMDILLSKPYKLKQGFLDFWLPIFLYCKRDDFALFNDGLYLPYLTSETLELVSKNPKEYEVKSFDIEGVKLDLFNSYRILLNQSTQDHPSAKSFIETIRPFLTFYRQLPEYAKNTSRLDKSTLALRNAIAQAKDPEETFFEKFPKALGYSITQLNKDKNELRNYTKELTSKIREIRTCYDELVMRFEAFIQDNIIGLRIPYTEYKTELQERFIKIKKHLLLPYQKTFYQRIYSELDDNKAWLNSIAQSCIGKSLEQISDDEEIILYEKLQDLVHELDNLCEISKSGFDSEKEIAFKLEVTSFVEGLKKNLVRLPKSKNKDLLQLQQILTGKLTKDRQLNIATLAKILEELLGNGK